LNKQSKLQIEIPIKKESLLDAFRRVKKNMNEKGPVFWASPF